MKKAALLVMILTILSKFLGFGREVVLSYVYGASAITDAYLISQTIPSQVFSFISAGIATGFIPMYSRILSEQGQMGAHRYTNNLNNIFFLLATVVMAVVMLFTQPLVKLFALGFTGETLELAVNFTRISVFAVYFSALLSIFSGYLRLYDNFVIPALVGFPFNLILITSFFVSTKTSIYVIAIGSVLATAAQLLLLIPFIRRIGFRYQPVFDMNNKYIRMMIVIALPVMMSQSLDRINVLVDRTLASAIAVGGISALNYATRLDGFVQGFFVDSMTTVLYPMISKMAVEGNVKGLKAYVAEAISIINLLVVPATIGAMLFSKQIVTLLFGRGAFTPGAIDMTATALFFYSIGMIAKGLRSILSRAFYAFQDTKTPMINASIGVTLNIILNLILSRYMGIGGLALATSIAAIVTAVLMFISLRKKIGGFGLKEISRSFIKISIASVLMGFIAYGAFFFSGKFLSQNVSLILAIGVGALVYAVMVYFLKIPEADSALKAVKRKIGMRFNSSKGF